MKLKVWLIGVAVAAATLQAGMVLATKIEVVVKADNKENCAAVIAAVHQQMAPGGHYEFVTNSERRDIDARFNDMQSLFDRYGTVDKMDQKTKVQMFNDQEAVNAILTRRKDDRLVCESERPLGSNIPRTTCRTNRQIEQARRDSQELRDRWNHTVQPQH